MFDQQSSGKMLLLNNKFTKIVISLILAGGVGCFLFLILLPPSQASNLSASLIVYPEGGSKVLGNIPEFDSGVTMASGCSEGPVKLFAHNRDQQHPRVAYNPIENSYLVVWEDNRTGNFDIYGVIMPEGCPYPASAGIIPIFEDSSTGSGQKNVDQTLPDVVYNPDQNKYFVTWHDAETGVWGRRISSKGQLEGNPVKYFSHLPGGVYTNSVVTYDAREDAQYLLVSQKVGTLDDQSTIRLRRIQAADLKGLPSQDLSPAANRQQLGGVAHNSLAGTNLTVWAELDPDETDFEVYAQGFDREGARIGQEIPISIAPYDQASPATAFNQQCDAYLIVWEDARNSDASSGSDIFRQSVPGIPTLPLPLQLPIRTTPTQTERNPDITAHLTQTEYLVAWQAQNAGEAYSNIYAQRVDCAGMPLPGQNLVHVSNMNQDQLSPVVAYLAREEKYLIVWSGKTSDTDFDIFADLLDTNLVDIIPPRVIDSTPEHGETDVPVSLPTITIRFSEAMSTATVSLSTTPTITISYPPSWGEDEQSVTFKIGSTLRSCQKYTITVTGEDKAGNEIEVKPGENPWSFTTQGPCPIFLPIIGQCFPFIDLENGDFESGLSPWVKEEVNGHRVELICSDDGYGYAAFNNNTCVVRLGSPALGSGNPNRPDIPNGHAAISQQVSIPCSGSPVLKFDYYFCSYDITAWGGKLRDSLEVSLGSAVIERIGFSDTEPPPDYLRCKPPSSVTIPLSSYSGHVVDLAFIVWNREPGQIDQGYGYRKTWAYIDNIRIE
jgi:hypothetical protein